MRKMWTFIFIIILFSLLMLAPKYENATFINGSVQFFLSNQCSQLEYATVTPNGKGSIVEADVKFDEVLEKTLGDYTGKTYILSGDANDFSKIKSLYQVKVDVEQSKSDNILGYTTKFDKGIIIGGKKINIQMLMKDGKIYIGTPILLGSY